MTLDPLALARAAYGLDEPTDEAEDVVPPAGPEIAADGLLRFHDGVPVRHFEHLPPVTLRDRLPFVTTTY